MGSNLGKLVHSKQLVDEVFVISRITKVEVGAILDSPYQDFDYSGYHKNRI